MGQWVGRWVGQWVGELSLRGEGGRGTDGG